MKIYEPAALSAAGSVRGFQMNTIQRALSGLAIAGASLCAMKAAQANSFNMEITGNQITDMVGAGPANGTPVSASLLITTAGDASSFETVTAISGTVFGQTITGLGGQWLGTSNINQFSSGSLPVHDYGIYFTTANGEWQITTDRLGTGILQNMGTSPDLGTKWLLTPAAISISQFANLPMAAVPEPETYAMLVAGLGVLGAMGRRQKKQACRAALAG